jgi:DNA polymerase-3 subunit epsilon
MREIVFDTETTGFDPETGDRIVEIGALELLNHMPTGRTFHVYLNPERGMPDGAFGVHGIGCDLLDPPRAAKPGEVTLRDKPLFRDVAGRFLDFIGDAKLVAHNAGFDMKFLNAELRRLNLPALDWARAIDTLEIAKGKYPGSPASLDALCRRFGIDNSARTLHGALLDSEILAEVYLELIGGRQPDFGLSVVSTGQGRVDAGPWKPGPRPAPLSQRLTEAERAAHQALVAKMGDAAVWRKYQAPDQA